MKNYIYKIVIASLCTFSISSHLFSEIVDARYIKLISQIEDLIPTLDLWSTTDAEKKAAIEIIKNNLETLRAGTKSSYRLARINKAAQSFGEFMQEDSRRKARSNVPLAPIAQAPKRQGITPEQQLETLLLYVQSLASTVNVAITIKQKDNAQNILAQAAAQIPLMQKILEQNKPLAQKYFLRINAIANRIATMQNEIDLLV